MSKKSDYKEQKRVTMSAFKAKYPLNNSISNAYDIATDEQQMLMFLCASMPAEKVKTALHIMGNLIKSNDEVYNELDKLAKETLIKEAGELFNAICEREQFKSNDDLKAFFVNGITYALSNEKTVSIQTKGDNIVICDDYGNTVVNYRLVKGDADLLQEAITKSASLAIESAAKENNLQTHADLINYFAEGKKFMLPFQTENSAPHDSFFIIKSHENSLIVGNANGVVVKFDLQSNES